MFVEHTSIQTLTVLEKCTTAGVYSKWSLFAVGMHLTTLVLAVLLSGCFTTFHEDHYFQSVSSQSGRATNYFRLQVDGWAALSSARYIAGYYDERAIDLFFNEVKTGSTQPPKLFEQELIEPGGTEKLEPLSPDNKNGKLIMVLSTNAKAVTDAIGQFSESQVVADSVTNLLNRRDILDVQRTNAKLGPEIGRANAIAAELAQLFAMMPAAAPSNAAPTASQVQDVYLRILNAVGVALGSPQSFSSIQQAEAWFQTTVQAERGR